MLSFWAVQTINRIGCFTRRFLLYNKNMFFCLGNDSLSTKILYIGAKYFRFDYILYLFESDYYVLYDDY